MGRSRKPLTGQPVRGFESHPLRQCTSFDPGEVVPDASVYRSNDFSLLLPVGNEAGPFPLLV